MNFFKKSTGKLLRKSAAAAICMTLLLSAESAIAADGINGGGNKAVAVSGAGLLIPSGKTAGIKLFSDGVMVSGLSPIETNKGEKSPAAEAGVRDGDIITHISGKKVNTNEELKKLISESNGKELSVSVIRGNQTLTFKIRPVVSKIDGGFRIGAWVRDSMAGIGTITFIDPETGVFGALGHGVCDVDTGKIMPIGSGTIMPSTVTGIKRGTAGSPGELKGAFDVETDSGILYNNTVNGIFGILSDENSYSMQTAIEAAADSEIKTGKATIMSNVDGVRVDSFEIEIVTVSISASGQRDMVFKVVDDRLIALTGGIVQGMSGSPIIQGGKLIGAVTHVLVNDPTRGYAISINNMLKNAELLRMKEGIAA